MTAVGELRERTSSSSVERVRVTPVAWRGHVELTLEEWRGYGATIGVVCKSTNWWVGDWLRFGQRRYGDRYPEASELTGYDEKTLRNFAYVAGRFEMSRRRDNLSWSHHAELAALEPDDQDYWLERAVERHLSVRRLRAALRAAQLLTGDLEAGPTVESSAVERGDEELVCPHCGHMVRVPAPPPHGATVRQP